jgi:hypothetical protein
MKMEQIECSEKSEYKIETPENYPEEIIQHKAQLKLKKIDSCYKLNFFFEVRYQ